MRYVLFFMLLASVRTWGQGTFPPIGMWREELPYGSALDVTASDQKVYCATPYSLFSVDLSGAEVQRWSKVSGLSETGISTINYDPAAQKLIVAYSNGNIDILEQNAINNVPGFLRAAIAGDKTVYHIFPNNEHCYLATGIGVVVVDAVKYQISDSWFIGTNGGYVKTYDFTRNDSFYYAATEEGLKKAPVTAPEPADFHSWQVVSGSNGLPMAACKAVMTLGTHTVALEHDSLYMEYNGTWSLFFTNGWPVVSANVSENQLILCQRTAAGASQVVVLDAAGNPVATLQQPTVISFPQKAISKNKEYWVADLYGGLSHWTGGQAEVLKPNSPEDVATGQMLVVNNVFYATAGAVNQAWNYEYNRNGIYEFSDGNWTNYNQFHFPLLDSMMDFIAVAIDPRDGSIWGGSYGGGLLHIRPNNQMEIFKQNSPLRPAVGDPGSYRVSGLSFDADNNLWIANFGSDRELHVLKKDSTWQSFTVPFLLDQNAVAQIVIDDANQKWIMAPHGNGVLVFNDGNTIDNASDDRWKLYRPGAGQGNLPSSEVTCLAKDKSGFIWVGTTNGIGIIQCPDQAFTSSGCETVWPVIQSGAFANYLFNGQTVYSIAVDGADRKWVGTPEGAWLISAEGDKVLQHFTEANSALLSDDVRSVAINGTTGEVYFGTAKGICSYRGAATEAAETNGHVLVFPNPVPPGYQGTIGIRGLPENSIVKITEANGRLVYETRSLGGQAVWNGRNYKGEQASSGVYLVLAEDELKQEKVVAKIVLIAKR